MWNWWCQDDVILLDGSQSIVNRVQEEGGGRRVFLRHIGKLVEWKPTWKVLRGPYQIAKLIRTNSMVYFSAQRGSFGLRVSRYVELQHNVAGNSWLVEGLRRRSPPESFTRQSKPIRFADNTKSMHREIGRYGLSTHTRPNAIGRKWGCIGYKESQSLLEWLSSNSLVALHRSITNGINPFIQGIASHMD